MSKNQKLFVAKFFTLAVLMANLLPSFVFAVNLTDSSMELGDPRINESSTYTFSSSGFTTGTTINCIQIELDEQADGQGNVPSNIDTTSFSLDSSSVITSGSWTEDNSVNGLLRITNAGGQTPNASGNIVFGAIDNGDTEDIYYAIVETFANVDCSTGGPIDSVVVAFAYTDGELVELTIGPTLTFSCIAVSASQSINGATTTHASTASGIDFSNDVTASTNAIAAHDLEVTTNAQSGYIVYIRHTGLTNASSDTIDSHTGTNVAPTSFSAAGTESWGYTSNDASLTGGTTDRFTNPGNLWAGYNTINEPVAYNSSAVPVTETTRVGHQVGISTDTEAGSYRGSIIYTLVATF